MKGVTVWTLGELGSGPTNCEAEVNGKWVPARPMGFSSLRHRLRCAWLAFTGRCDLVWWPEGQ